MESTLGSKAKRINAQMNIFVKRDFQGILYLARNILCPTLYNNLHV